MFACLLALPERIDAKSDGTDRSIFSSGREAITAQSAREFRGNGEDWSTGQGIWSAKLANVWISWQEVFTVSVNYSARALRIAQAEFENGGTLAPSFICRMRSSCLRAGRSDRLVDE
jgi:hypothetical protein